MVENNLGGLRHSEVIDSYNGSRPEDGVVGLGVDGIRYKFGSTIYSILLDEMVVQGVESDLLLGDVEVLQLEPNMRVLMYRILLSNLLNPENANYKSGEELADNFVDFVERTIRYFIPGSLEKVDEECVEFDFEELMSSPVNYNSLEVRAIVKEGDQKKFTELFFSYPVGDDEFRGLRLDVLDAMTFEQIRALVEKNTSGYIDDFGQYRPLNPIFDKSVYDGQRLYSEEQVYRYFLSLICTYKQEKKEEVTG